MVGTAKIEKKLYKLLFVLFSGAFFLFILLYFTDNSFSIGNNIKKLEIDFFDVGQGDSILVKTPYNQNILIDGGPDNKIIKELGKNLLWNDKKIDLVILTHPHDDHITGLIQVLKNYDVKKIIYTGVLHSSPNYIEWLNIVKDKKIPLTIIDRPQKIDLGNNLWIDIIYPDKNFSGLKIDNLNNSSIVAMLNYKNNKIFFTGDIEAEVEEVILEKNINIKSDLLKVAHHGSDTSSGEKFLEAIDPKKAVIEVGENNKFGHPSLRVLNRLKRLDTLILRTDINRTIKIYCDGDYCG